MKFLKDIKESVYGPSYYNAVKDKPFSYSLKYYLLLSLLVAFLSTVMLSFVVVPKIKTFLNVFTEEVLNIYPEELTITIRGGEAFTNVQEPYFIEAPQEWKEGFPSSYNIENIVVIDTETSFSMEKFRDYRSLCYLSREGIACYEENGAVTVTSLREVPDIMIDKALVSSSFQKVSPFLNLIYPVVFILFWMGLFVFLLFRLVYLLIAALLVWGIYGIKKVKIGYKKSYQIGMHLMTLPVLLTLLIQYPLNFLGMNIRFPFLFTILFLVAAALNLRKAGEDKTN